MEARIETIDKEIETRLENIKTQLDSVIICEDDQENIDEAKDEKCKDIKCKYFDKGFCKMKETCLFRHKSMKICEDHLTGTKCSNKECEKIFCSWRTAECVDIPPCWSVLCPDRKFYFLSASVSYK